MESALYGIYALVFVSRTHSFHFWYVNYSYLNVPYGRTFHEVVNIYTVPLPRVFWILLEEFWLMMIESFNGHRGITLT